jgi:uncharacterized iron-regulated protein
MSPRPLVLLAVAAAACAPRVDPRLVAQPIEGRTWVSALHRDHPLVGRIWDARRGAFVDEGALAAALAEGDFVLLGEVHDNADHHLLQARLVRAITAAGRRPALAFEMLATDQQPAVDGALARAPSEPDALAKAVGWKESGWPDFALYRPIFAAGLEAGLPVVAANLPRAQAKAIVGKGEAAIDPALRARLARDEPLPAEVREALRGEMRESHCGALPEPLLDPLILAQRARDAQMALRLEETGAGRGAILVTGNGHVRTDRGVPALLAQEAPGRKIVAVALVEVEPEVKAPGPRGAYGESGVPADFVVFTPGAERDDPCEGLVERARARAKREERGGAERKDTAPGEAAPAAPPEATPPR